MVVRSKDGSRFHVGSSLRCHPSHVQLLLARKLPKWRGDYIPTIKPKVKILSKYLEQDVNNWMGPPHDGNWNIVSPSFSADGACLGDWKCEHRWRQIYNMVEVRNVVAGSYDKRDFDSSYLVEIIWWNVTGTTLNDWWDNGNNQIAFCRGGKGFVALNNDGYDLFQNLQVNEMLSNKCWVIKKCFFCGRLVCRPVLTVTSFPDRKKTAGAPENPSLSDPMERLRSFYPKMKTTVFSPFMNR